ncbi:hypothetical protein OFY17_05220 [Marinomonas sp. C2222]|uniref:Uncharacterized protein n=1 Tax=Marinomonas sargassi TaxID=2984494 RepID=A0ABT2YQX6_9GAMM|nr:hypothetical protein [Marinomonas sargassi]MCV2402285.1 hypothetical protein [Marinomonas sargassi]
MNKIIKIFMLGVIFSSFTASASEEVLIDSDRIVFVGEISKEKVDEVVFKYKKATQKPKLLRIKSSGGDLYQSIRLGKWVYLNGLDVEVAEYCYYSCASYIFTAGNKKYLDTNSYIFWNGGALSKFLQDDYYFQKIQDKFIARHSIIDPEEISLTRARLDRRRQFFIAEEKGFFDFVKVDPMITLAGAREGQYLSKKFFGISYVDVDKFNGKPIVLGFYYTLKEMEKFGVKNVVLKSSEWKPQTSFNHGFYKIIPAEIK